MKPTNQSSDLPVITSPVITSLDQLVANTCFCKLKATCPDKNSSECMRHRNIYAEFMAEKRETHAG